MVQAAVAKLVDHPRQRRLGRRVVAQPMLDDRHPREREWRVRLGQKLGAGGLYHSQLQQGAPAQGMGIGHVGLELKRPLERH